MTKAPVAVATATWSKKDPLNPKTPSIPLQGEERVSGER